MKSVNLEIQPDVPKVPAYILNAPKIKLEKAAINTTNGAFNLRETVYKPGVFNNWTLIYFGKSKKDDADVFFIKKTIKIFFLKGR